MSGGSFDYAFQAGAASNRPTLKSNKAGKHYIESIDGKWV